MSPRKLSNRWYPVKYRDPDLVVHAGFMYTEIRETACEEMVREVTWSNDELIVTQDNVTCVACLVYSHGRTT